MLLANDNVDILLAYAVFVTVCGSVVSEIFGSVLIERLTNVETLGAEDIDGVTTAPTH